MSDKGRNRANQKSSKGDVPVKKQTMKQIKKSTPDQQKEALMSLNSEVTETAEHIKPVPGGDTHAEMLDRDEEMKDLQDIDNIGLPVSNEEIKPVPGGGMGTRTKAEFMDFHEIDNIGLPVSNEEIKPVPGAVMATCTKAEMLDRDDEFKDFQQIDNISLPMSTEDIKPVPGDGRGNGTKAEMLDRDSEFKDFQEIDNIGLSVSKEEIKPVPGDGMGTHTKPQMLDHDEELKDFEEEIDHMGLLLSKDFLDLQDLQDSGSLPKEFDFHEMQVMWNYILDGGMRTRIQAKMHKGNNDLLEGTTDTRAAADKIVVGLTPTPPEVLQNCYLDGGVGTRIQGHGLDARIGALGKERICYLDEGMATRIRGEGLDARAGLLLGGASSSNDGGNANRG
jgi:hypothetical protein